MLLDRLPRPVRGVRLVRRDQNTPDAPFRTQVVPLRLLVRSEVERVLYQLDDDSGPVVTTALGTREQQPFLEAGFTPRESLYLLRHDLRNLPHVSSPTKIRSGRRGDLQRVLDIDHESFDDFWTFDRHGLTAARRATPSHRYVVAIHDRQIAGFAVSGHAGSTGYLQRLGVAKDFRKRGIGSQLIVDGLQWTIDQGASEMLVNTQEVNKAALRLYESHGFILDDERLTVLEWQR